MTMGEVELALDDDTTKRRGPEGFTACDPHVLADPKRLEARRRRSVRERLAEARKQ